MFSQRQLGLCWGLVSSPGAQEAASEMDSSIFVIQANRVLKVRLGSEKCIGFLSAQIIKGAAVNVRKDLGFNFKKCSSSASTSPFQ